MYTATATYGGKTYVSTKTLDDKASGHIWEFDTSDENAEWTEKSGGGFSKVTVKKTCISDYHDEEKDGARERSVESTNITEEKVPSTICGKPDIITYTATFTNIEDSAITNPFTVTKVVEGDPLKHDWVVDTNADHVSWLGTDTAGYTKATITKTCQNAGHSGEGDTASAIKITVDVQKTATEATACEEGDVTHYTAVFTSKDDPAITENLTFTKDVTSDPHPHEWTFETSEDKVTWTGNDTDGYTKATITKTCQSKYHDVTKNGSATVSVTVDVVKTTTAAEACGEPAKIHYTAVFDSNVDPAITTPLTFEKVVDSDVLQHDWVLKTDGENVVWIGSDADGYTEVLITKTCKNEQHDETRNGAKNVLLSSKNITVSTVTACGKPDETHYVASFDSTIDPLITEAFTVEKVVKGTTVREHEWKFDTDPEHVTWVGNDEDGYTRAIIKKQCLSQYHNEQVNGPREVSVSVKPTMSYDEDVACGETTQIIYTAVFDSMVDPALTETLIFEKTVEGIALPHDWVFDTDPEDAVWTGSDEEGYTKVTVKKTCKNPKHDEEISGPAEVSVSAEVKVSTTPAEKCKEPSKIHYTAVFDETVDPDIGKAFTLEKIVDGPVLEHDWNYDVDPDHVIWGASAAETYILRTCLNGEVKHGSDNSERWAAASLTVNVTDGSCNSAYTKTMTAVFKDENGNEFFTTTKTETAAECHTFKISASNPLWHWNIGNGTETYYTGADCVFTCSAGNHKVTVPAVVVRNVAGDTVVYNAKVQVSYYDENGLFFYNEEFTDTRYTRLNSEGKEVSPYSGATESGKTISEPEDDVSHNLFYTDCDITIPLPEGADPSKGSGKWTAYYKVDSDGTVTLLKTSKDDVKKGASAGNSLIVMPICDAEGNTIGEFEYQLPVFYQKPALKLSSKSGVVNTALPDPMSLSTIVLEKKSTGVYEALDLSSIDTSSLWTGKSETAPTISLGDKAGELLITTGQKMSGKLCIRLKNWRETIELKYSVKASNKSVLSGSVNKLYMNTHFFEKGEAETCYITINGREVTSEDNISVTFPKNWESSGIDIEGIEGGILTQSELSFCYRTDQEPKKGSFTFTFKSPDGEKFKLKLTISNKELDKAVSLKVYTKMNITTGQKLVLIPNLTNCGGHIEAVTIDNDNYVIEYIEELNEILVDVAEGKSVSAGVFTPTITLSINGYDCPVAVKTKIAVTSPAVKISKVNLPKDSAAAGTAEGEASIRATIKSGGKIFEIRPEDVIFPNASLYNEEGWYAVNGVIVKWNQEEGTISVRTPGDGQKISSVKVELYFKGKTVKKILTLKVK
ncbi:MAG: hypothetical protein IKS18_01750 [Lachnospiraceae bacterium]|nr:hypothetical protein [Lachnospiraceae bacterium]